MEVRVKANQLAARLFTHYENLLAVPAGQRREVVQRASRQLNGPGIALVEQTPLFMKSPDVRPPVPRRLENEVFPIRRPLAATLSGRTVPAGEERM